MSVSALDAALLLAKDGEHLLSEALTVKARAVTGGIGNSGNGSSPTRPLVGELEEHTEAQRLGRRIRRLQ